MRHGHSLANSSGLIISDPATGTESYGLSPEGIAQVKKAAELHRPDRDIIICSSDFRRTRETSRILAEAWNAGEIIFTPNLRERFFGIFEGKSNNYYRKVWDMDKSGEDLKEYSIETPGEVAARVQDFITEMEEKYSDKSVFLISHGDCLQILQAAAMDLPPREHRSIPHLEVAEIRELFK